MGIAIIGLGKGFDQNPAPLSDYTAIYSGLGGSSPSTQRFIIINGAGEALPYSTQLHTQFQPSVVAQHVNKGGIWIEYCGYPMYYQVGADGSVAEPGPAGWAQFVGDLGPGPARFGWLSKLSFVTPFSSMVAGNSSRFVFVRGFPLAQSLDGVCYADVPITISGGLLGIFGGIRTSTTEAGMTAMVAIRHPTSGGIYFYGVYTPESTILSSRAGVIQAVDVARGVPVDTYIQFINSVIAGNTAGLICQPYKTNTQKIPANTTGQSSPTSTSSPGPSGASGGGTSHSGGLSGSSSGGCPAGTHMVGNVCVANSASGSSPSVPKWVGPVGAGVLVLGGLGVSGYALFKGRRG